MVIRDYRAGDFQQVEELWQQTGIYTIERGDTSDLIIQCTKMGGKFLVLEDPSNGSVAGTSWMSYDGRRIHLHHFAVRPSLQGKGFGRILAEASLKFAREKNYPVKLEVHSKNLPAVNLYKSLGFTAFEGYDVYMSLNP